MLSIVFLKLRVLKNLYETNSCQRGSMSKKSKQSKQHTTTQMAMFAAIGDKFICSILKQVAADYSLDYKELKRRYTGPTSLEEYEPSAKSQRDMEEFDLETETVKPVKPKEKPVKPVKPKEKPVKPKKVKKSSDEPVVPMALSKMKKQDLIDELDSLGIDSDGLTVVKLKEKVKEARESAGVVVAKGGRKPKAVKEVPVHTHEPLDEELVDDCRLCASHGNVMVGGTQLVPEEPDDGEEFSVANEDVLKARLAAILAEADGDEEDDEEAEDLDSEATEGEELDLEDY